MVLLLVVGVMDEARAEILGDGNISLSFVEHFSQVCCVPLNMYMMFVDGYRCACVVLGVWQPQTPFTSKWQCHASAHLCFWAHLVSCYFMLEQNYNLHSLPTHHLWNSPVLSSTSYMYHKLECIC